MFEPVWYKKKPRDGGVYMKALIFYSRGQSFPEAFYFRIDSASFVG